MVEQLGNPSIWADTGGLPGLVILALFMMLAIGLLSAKGVIKIFREEICKLLEMQSAERDKMVTVIDDRQRETNEAIRAMTIAINKLAERHRRFDMDGN